MNKNDCDEKFGASNISKVEPFRINTGKVDFGDDIHMAARPVGEAIICWLHDGRVAVLGKLYSDNFFNAQEAIVEIDFRRRNGNIRTVRRTLSTQGGVVSSRDIEEISRTGDFTRVEIRLIKFIADSGGGPVSTVVATRTFRRAETVRLHIKILTEPTVPIDTMLEAMRQVYATADIDVDVRSTENLVLSSLTDIDVGECVTGSTTYEQNELFGHRNSVGANEIVAYFVRSTVPVLKGCAAHPVGRPSVVVAQGATQFTLGHEIGHVLGLRHVNRNNRLMTGNGTRNIVNLPPDLSYAEVRTMLASELTITQ